MFRFHLQNLLRIRRRKKKFCEHGSDVWCKWCKDEPAPSGKYFNFSLCIFIVLNVLFCRNISPTHPSMMPAGIPPIRGVSGAGARVPLRGPMGRGEYGECFLINHSSLLLVTFGKNIKAIISLVFLSNMSTQTLSSFFVYDRTHLLRNTMKFASNLACDTFYKTFIFVYNG